ncbi:hypothetical protein [Serratia fonticola]
MKIEFYLLENMVDYMEVNGVTMIEVSLSINQNLVDNINKKHKTKLSLGDLEKAANVCLANEWLKLRSIGPTKYDGLEITTSGAGIVRSKRSAEQKRKARPLLKKTSDFIEEHKGIITFITAIIAIIGLYLNYLRIK